MDWSTISGLVVAALGVLAYLVCVLSLILTMFFRPTRYSPPPPPMRKDPDIFNDIADAFIIDMDKVTNANR